MAKSVFWLVDISCRNGLWGMSSQLCRHPPILASQEQLTLSGLTQYLVYSVTVNLWIHVFTVLPHNTFPWITMSPLPLWHNYKMSTFSVIVTHINLKKKNMLVTECSVDHSRHRCYFKLHLVIFLLNITIDHKKQWQSVRDLLSKPLRIHLIMLHSHSPSLVFIATSNMCQCLLNYLVGQDALELCLLTLCAVCFLVYFRGLSL